jgi:hypothetical protein
MSEKFPCIDCLCIPVCKNKSLSYIAWECILLRSFIAQDYENGKCFYDKVKGINDRFIETHKYFSGEKYE